MRIAIGADHAGFTLKEHLKETLTGLGHQVKDFGTHSDASVDYPPICAAVGRAVVGGDADRGIVLGGSGQELRIELAFLIPEGQGFGFRPIGIRKRRLVFDFQHQPSSEGGLPAF